MKLVQNVFKVFTAIIIVAFSANLEAQTLEEAGAAFNKAIELSETDVDAAITAFESSIKIFDKIIANPESEETEFTAVDLKMKAEQQLPNLYFKSATTLYKEKKYEEAIKRYEETVVVCEKYNDESNKDKANGNIATLYSMQASAAYKSKEYDKALALFDQALEKNPSETRALFGKGLVLRKQDKDDEMIAVLEKAIEVGSEDDKSVVNSKKLLAGHYSIEGAKLIEKKLYNDAIALQQKALSYDDTYANAYFYSAVVYNLQSNWDTAIEKASKGLELEDGNNEDKAKFYFELGNAYKGKGNNADACSAYTKASFGDYAEKAKLMKTELKCE